MPAPHMLARTETHADVSLPTSMPEQEPEEDPAPTEPPVRALECGTEPTPPDEQPAPADPWQELLRHPECEFVRGQVVQRPPRDELHDAFVKAFEPILKTYNRGLLISARSAIQVLEDPDPDLGTTAAGGRSVPGAGLGLRRPDLVLHTLPPDTESSDGAASEVSSFITLSSSSSSSSSSSDDYDNDGRSNDSCSTASSSGSSCTTQRSSSDSDSRSASSTEDAQLRYLHENLAAVVEMTTHASREEAMYAKWRTYARSNVPHYVILDRGTTASPTPRVIAGSLECFSNAQPAMHGDPGAVLDSLCNGGVCPPTYYRKVYEADDNVDCAYFSVLNMTAAQLLDHDRITRLGERRHREQDKHTKRVLTRGLELSLRLREFKERLREYLSQTDEGRAREDAYVAMGGEVEWLDKEGEATLLELAARAGKLFREQEIEEYRSDLEEAEDDLVESYRDRDIALTCRGYAMADWEEAGEDEKKAHEDWAECDEDDREANEEEEKALTEDPLQWEAEDSDAGADKAESRMDRALGRMDRSRVWFRRARRRKRNARERASTARDHADRARKRKERCRARTARANWRRRKGNKDDAKFLWRGMGARVLDLHGERAGEREGRQANGSPKRKLPSVT